MTDRVYMVKLGSGYDQVHILSFQIPIITIGQILIGVNTIGQILIRIKFILSFFYVLGTIQGCIFVFSFYSCKSYKTTLVARFLVEFCMFHWPASLGF